MAFGDIFKEIDNLTANKQLLDPTTNLPVKEQSLIGQSIDTKTREQMPVVAPEIYTDREASSYTDKGIPLGTGEYKDLMMDDMRANAQSNLIATKNAILKASGKALITVGDTLLGSALSIPIAIANSDFTKFFDNDVRRFFDKGSEYLDDNLKVYATKAQEQEGFFSQLNNAQFWGDKFLGGMSFTVGAVLSEMALSALTAATFGATAELQAAETASLLSRAKKIFSAFRGEASAAELKAWGKDIVKSGVVGAGYEAGVEARNFLDTARKNYAEQYKQQYGVEPDANALANAEGEIKKTANLIFGANMALLSVGNFIQFKNIFGKGLSTDLKLFGKGAVDTEAKDLAKDYALRGTLNAAIDNTSKLRKTLYTIPKILKNPLLEYNEEASQGEFQAIGQDYIKKKFDATSYNDSFNLIDSFSKNFKDTYGSEDAGIGFIIGAMGIPGMGIATGKTKNVKGFGNKVIASFEGGIAEAFEEQNAEKNAIKTAIKGSSKVNIDNVQEQVRSNSAIYTSNKQRDEALANGDFFEAKNHESDALFSFVKSRDNVGLLNESKEQYSAMIKDMDNATFAKEFGYDIISDNEVALDKTQLEERKTKVIEQFNKRVDNFQETKDLASKVAPVRDFNDKDARLFNEAIHHLMYTTNDLDSREDSLVKIINDKLSKSKNDSINNDRFKELMSFHNTWFNLSDKTISKELKAYTKELKTLTDMDAISLEDETDLTERKNKSKAKLKALKSTIQTKLDEINNSKDKLSKLGFNINNNFENVDNFTQAFNEFNDLQKNIENHLSENIFDKDTIEESILDLQKIQNKRHELIGTYNTLNTKNGRTKFNEEAKKLEREFKIEYLKIQASKFLHNQGLELDKDTIKEIENNVDLQVKEDDSPEVKAQKQAIKNYSDNIDSQNDVTELTNLVEYLRQFKEGVDDSLKTNVNTLIAKAIQKIKDLKQTKDASEKQKIEDGKRPYFSNINELFSLFNNEQQKNKLASIANNPDEKDLRKRITFTLTDLENPKSIEQAVADLKEKDNQNVISLSGVRGNNKPFNFQMKVDGELIGGFQMPNQLYLKINNKWNPIDFSKLKEDGYLTTVLEMLFPSDLISTTEDRKVLGQYLTELNSFSNKLSNITQRGDISFEDFNNLTSGQINLNTFASQIEMNFTDDKDKDGNIIETKIEDTLDDPDNVLTKAATKTIKVNGEDKNIVIFGKSTGDGQGFSKLYFVNIINGKLERNEDGSVLWRDRDDKENSEERKAIQSLVSYKKENAISTKGSLFSLLVFNPNGYIQPIFTSNETISKLKGLDNNEEFIVNFLNNEKALLPALQIMSEGLSSYYEEYKDITKEELDPKEDIKNFDLFLSVTGLDKTEKVKITPFISTYSDKIGQLSFNLEINKKDNVISSSIYFDGQNFFKSFAKGKEELEPINKRFEKGEITLAQKIEEIKKFRHEVLNENKLNEEIASLILKDSQYTVLGKLRKATNTNAAINGFYSNVLLNKNNQQSLENLVTKKKLGYNLYLRPDRTQVKEITSTRENIRLRNEKQQEELRQQQKAKEQVQNKEQEDLFNENTIKLEAQEEAKTIQEINANAPIADVTNTNTAALFNLDDYTDEQLIAAYTKANGNTPPNNPSNLRNWLSTEANQKLKLYKNTISNLPELIQQQPAKTEVQDTSIEDGELWSNRETIFTNKTFVAKDGNTYTIEETESKSGNKIVKVKNSKGETIASGYFSKNSDGTYSIAKGTKIESNILGIGLATAIYDHVDTNIGKVKRTDTTTDDGDILWKNNKNKINAKYDAELAALNNKKTVEAPIQPVVKKDDNIEKRREELKTIQGNLRVDLGGFSIDNVSKEFYDNILHATASSFYKDLKNWISEFKKTKKPFSVVDSLEIITKYDAELAALEPTKKQTSVETWKIGDKINRYDSNGKFQDVVEIVENRPNQIRFKQEDGSFLNKNKEQLNEDGKLPQASYKKETVKIEVKQTPNIDKLEALGVNFEQLPKEEDLLSRVYRRSKISEKGLSLEEFVQIVTNAQNEAETEGANKLLELSTQDLIEYNTAIKNLSQILPIKTQDNPNGTIEVTDLIDILGNLKTKGEVGGRFIGKLKTIYLATKNGKSVKGFEYHEAFHAVFRMMLTDSQIYKYLKSAEELYGAPNDTQLEELRNSSSDLINLSKTELKNIWLEERMADAFMQHKVVPQSWLARLFNKIKAFINGIFGVNQDTQLSNENAITQLFNDIYQGKFKNAKEKFPVIRNVDNVNKLLVQEYKLKLTNGKYIDKKGYLSYSISEAIINTITNETAKILKDKGSKTITDDEISDIYDLFKERFNPDNEVISDLIDSIENDDLANKTASKYLNVYKSLGNLKNQEIVVQEVFERLPLYNLVNESSILQEQLDDSDDLEDDELNDTGIVQKSKNEINHAWDKASKKVKQYISSVSTNIDLFGIGKPFDDYIVNDKSKNYNFAINGNHLYSNLTKMLVGAPAYKHLSLLHSVSNTSPEIKAFAHQWYKDIYSELRKNKTLELPEINVEDFSKLYEILSPLYYKTLTSSPTFSFISSDFEKNRTYLQDVLFSKEGVTRMLNANNRNVGKQVFSKWERNWNSKRIDNLEQAKIDFKENLYESNIDNILQKYVDLLENKKGLTSQNKSNAVISLVKTFKNSFADLGIELPEQFIKYNLINFVFETGNTTLLTNEEIEWYNSFSASDIKPINLEFLDGIEKTLTTGISFGTNTIYNDIDPITQQAESLLGAVGKLMDIAESTALFDTSIIPSSFNNQEGKRIFDITPPSDISRRLNILKDKDNVQLIKEYLQTRNVQEFKDKVLNNEENGTYYLYSFFTEEYQVDNFLQALDHNPLFNNVDIDTLFTTLTMAYAGGIRQEETNVTEYEDSEDVDVSSKNYGLFSDSDGKSYNNADTTAKILYRLSLLADSKFNKYNLKVIGKQKYAYYIASQYEGKSTVPMVLLPFNNFIEKGKINEKGLNSLYSIYNQEVERIKIVQSEIDEYYLGFKKDGYNEGFHYMLQDIGVEGTNGNKPVKIFTHSDGTYFYLDIDNNNNVVNLSKEELYYNEKQEDGSTIKKEINLNSLTPKGLKLFNFANKNAKLNEKDLSEVEIKQRLSNFIDFQVDEYIKLLEDKGLLKEGEVNLLPKSFISGNQLDKNALKNAFLNDYLMSYGVNSLMYGDNAESTKNSNDFVKRAGGMIGSGPNYGSGLTNIIPIRSEVVNKIDTTDAQTFNTPFHHLSVILNSKSIDNRIREIYQGIDSGLNYYINSEGELQKITKEDYDYLYDNNAQHQPNKTQGFGLDWFLKTSISPILRETVSKLKDYSKENLKEALLIHKELFDLKLQALPSDNTYITFLTKKYQNLFEAIPGKEYKHNLLNDLELNNAIAVYDSAWKRSKYNIHEISNGKPFLYKDSNGKKVISSISVPNASLIDQQKTDGVKKQITHPTQFLRLISTEQINETLIYFKNKEINVGTALSVYEKQLAERTDKGFKALKKEVLDENGEAAWDLLLKSFIDSIEKSSADPQQLELFQQGNSSKPKYNLNNPAIETKFQSMFLSFVSSNTLKQKVAGSKLSLKSSIGHELEREIDNEGNVIKTFTTEQSKRDNAIRGANRVSQRLRHDVYDKVKHEYYSEIVVSERFLKKFGFTAEQFHKGEIPEEFLYISGVRIPTEDKHSMVNCKIVDILPDSYGNVVMLPNEIVELSGADFDIDALYVRVNQTYTNVLNKKTGIYSSYLTQPTLEEAKEKAYDEYLADAYDSNKISSTFNDLKTNNKELTRLNYEKNNLNQEKIKINDEIKNDHLFYNKNSFIETPSERLKSISNKLLETLDKIKNLELTLLEQSFDINKIIFNKEKWLENNSKLIENNYNAYQSGDISNINPLTKGETNNMLLELERKLINNNGNNKITNTPTSLKLFKDLIETLEGEGLINKDLGYGVHDMLSKTLADISISTGAANIGPVALFNNLFGILVKNKVTIERKVGEEINLEPFVNYSRDENNKLVDEKDAQRVQDSIATLLAAMTDNAKEQMANLFNLTTETLPVALSMIGVGHNFNNVMLLMKSPLVKKISELSQSYNKTIQSKQDYDDSKGNRELQKKVESIFQLEGESEFKGELNYNTLLQSLKYSQNITKAPLWSAVNTKVIEKYTDFSEEIYNSLSEEEKNKIIECL